ISRTGSCYYIPQLTAEQTNQSVAATLGIAEKLHALYEILDGNTADAHFTALGDDWTIEERCRQAFQYWGLEDVQLTQSMAQLSGGQQTKVLLAGMQVHAPDIILLDEPSNHLDADTRRRLYEFIRQSNAAFVIISHDRELLQLPDKTYEISSRGLKAYGGNFSFYTEQKSIELNALHESLKEAEKSIRKSKALEKQTMERQQRLDARGKKKQEKAGVAKIMMNTLRNQAEQSTARLKSVHASKQQGLKDELQELRSRLPDTDKIRLGFDNADLHRGKQLVSLEQVNCQYGDHQVWKRPLDFQLLSGQRWSISGANGSGKTTLINLLLGNIVPNEGRVIRAGFRQVYLDQHYTLLNAALTVYQQAQTCNEAGLLEHELKNRLNRFLFAGEDWDKTCAVLSGGERMRLGLCCLSLVKGAPDLIVLDEPTNNLDLQKSTIHT
ncbi:MAG: ABC-F family ATP-binding cassette domain-containing protein, partial [Bacteroidetes bacterium]|nr:ABC-F family ATP-binding cassette domain-containing protein [Bacteroidota bacterium]